ncbi:hypothetical protein ACIRD6_18630 [Streptomyces sp. NPDC102473]|uniref:hypothetical protein n=1 Tax=Streptomyces sp. NPDC102473 TaxID=3366180 RepID=UPI00382253EA
MTDEEPYLCDLLGKRLLGATVSQDGPAGSSSSLVLHTEEQGPFCLRPRGSTLSLTAVPPAGPTPAAETGQDHAMARFIGAPIRSVREIHHRHDGVDLVAGLTFQFPDGDVRVLVLDGELVIAHDRHLGEVEAHLHEDLTLARVVRTCLASPSQWDAWTTEGQYLYFRYRHGEGTVEQHPSEDSDTWDLGDSRLWTLWDDGTDGGEIALPDFLALAGLRLAPDAEVSVLSSWKGREVKLR